MYLLYDMDNSDAEGAGSMMLASDGNMCGRKGKFFGEGSFMPVMHAWTGFCGFCWLMDEFLENPYEVL